MDRDWYWRLGLVIGVTLLTIWLLIPSYVSLFVVERSQRNNLASVVHSDTEASKKGIRRRSSTAPALLGTLGV